MHSISVQFWFFLRTKLNKPVKGIMFFIKHISYIFKIYLPICIVYLIHPRLQHVHLAHFAPGVFFGGMYCKEHLSTF